MDLHGWIAVATLAAAILLFMTRWIPIEATALAIPVVLAATGTIDPARLVFQGFGNLAVIAIGAVFILGAGLRESGVATLMARVLRRLGRGSETRTVLAVMIPTCVLSAFMANAAAVAVFLPAVAVLSRRGALPASRLMMPLGFAAVLGGTLTLIGTTPNLILDEELRHRIGAGLGMFEFTLVGAPIVVVGTLVTAFVAVRLLPSRTHVERLGQVQLPEELAQTYDFVRDLYRVAVPPTSDAAGRSIEEVGFGREYGLGVVHVHRPGGFASRYLHPEPDLVIEAGDELYIEGSAEDAWRLSEERGMQFGVASPGALNRLLGHGLTIAEVTLAPHSSRFHSTLRDLDFRSRHGLNVVAIWRRDTVLTSDIGTIRLGLGDALLVSGPREKVAALAKDPDYVVLTDPSETEDVRRAPLAVLLLLAAILPPVFGWLPLAVSAVGSALLMVGLRCISLTGAQRSIDFRVLFLIIGTIPLGTALDQQGVAAAAAEAIQPLHGALGPAGVHLALFALSALLSMTCNNGAAAVILAPVAFQVAKATGMDLSRAYLAVAFGTSCVFMYPFGNQCNLMVMGPGGYRATDFLRAGTAVALAMAVVTVGMLSIL